MRILLPNKYQQLIVGAPENTNFSNNPLVSDNSAFANATGILSDYTTMERCSDDQRRDVEGAFNLARAATAVAMFDVERGTDSPYGFK